MVGLNFTYRETERWLAVLKTAWNEPVPDHTTICRHLQTIPQEWLDSVRAETARRCMAQVDWTDGSIGADSSAVETDRYEIVSRLDGKAGINVETPQKTYLKYHLVAALGLQIILLPISRSRIAVIAAFSSSSDRKNLPASLFFRSLHTVSTGFSCGV